MSEQISVNVVKNRLSLVTKSIEALADKRKEFMDAITRIEQDMIALAGEQRGLSALVEMAEKTEDECAVIEEGPVGS